MRQMPHAFAATALNAHDPHHGANHLYSRSGGDNDALHDLVLGNSISERFLPSEEGEAHVSVAHVLGLRKAAGVGIGHGDEFRVRHDVGHFLAPRSGIVATSCCVPTTQSMTAKRGHATYKSQCNNFVTKCGFQITNSVRVPKRHSKFVAASSSQAVANACEVTPPASQAPLPSQTITTDFAAQSGDKSAAFIQKSKGEAVWLLPACPLTPAGSAWADKAAAPHNTSAWSAS